MKAAPVIVVRKRRAHHAHHGGAWKVAYADFVTAMMAFFLVMWIVGQNQSVKAGVAGYFRDPGVLQRERSNGILEGHRAGVDTQTPPSLKTPAAPPDDAAARAALERSAQRIRELLAKSPELAKLQGQIKITATPEGLRIELIDSDASTFFDNASSVLKPATARVLAVIARELTPLAKPVYIEGHTDSRPYTNASYTNWELSADRANAARRAMELSGLPDALVRGVRGFGDKRLSNPDQPLDPHNRRVSILVAAQADKAPPH
jgi:chemotaxis protein MotB